MLKISARIKELWVAALRSGKYKQGKGLLRNDKDEFCCWGVLCDLAAKEHPEQFGFIPLQRKYQGSNSYMPCDGVCLWAGMEIDRDDGLLRDVTKTIGNYKVDIDCVKSFLSQHNDAGKTFAQIADAIENQFTVCT